MKRTGDIQKVDSMMDFINAARLPGTNGTETASGEVSGHRDEFTATKNMEEALNLAEFGWKDGLDQIEKALDEINAEPHVEPAPIFDVTGEAFNLDAVLQGQPEDMFFFMDQETNKPRVISLAFNFSHGCSITADQIMLRGAAIASAVNDIESAGIRVELFAYKVTTKRTRSRGYSRTKALIKIKDADQPLELERLCFAAAHPAMLRRLWFRVAEQYGVREFKQRFGDCYGSSTDLHRAEYQELDLENVIDVRHEDFTPDEVKATVKRQLDSILNNQ